MWIRNSALRGLNPEDSVHGSKLVGGAENKELARIVQRGVTSRVDDEIPVGLLDANHVHAHPVAGVQFSQRGRLQPLRQNIHWNFLQVDVVGPLDFQMVQKVYTWMANYLETK